MADRKSKSPEAMPADRPGSDRSSTGHAGKDLDTTAAASAHHRSRKRRWLAALAVVAITLAVFGRSSGFGFLGQDDVDNILVNPQLNPPTWRHVARFWREPYLSLYIPVTYTFWSGEAYLAWQTDRAGGRVEQPGYVPLDPRVFRAGSIALHTLVVLVVYLLLLRLVASPLPAAAGALLFALHPLQVESVGWITENKGLLSTLFSTLALWQVVAFWQASPIAQSRADQPVPASERNSKPRGARRDRRKAIGQSPSDRRWLHFAAATASFALALLAKPIAAALPLAAAAIAIGWLNRPWRSTVLELLPWCALTAAVAALTMGEQGATTITHLPPLWQRPLMAGDALAFYLLKLVVPLPLGGDYGRSGWRVMHSDWTYVMWLVPLGVLAALWWLPRRAIWLAAAIVFIAGLLPVSGLAPFAYQNASTVADRYAYLAMLGPALAVAAWLATKPDWRRLVPTAIVLAIFAALSFRQLGTWRNDLTWTNQALAVNPVSFYGLESQAQFLQRQGRAAEALAMREMAHQRNPHAIEPCYRLAESATARGDIQGAVAWYREALKIQPDSNITHGYLAECLARQGDESGALDAFRLAASALRRDRNVAAQGTRVGAIFSERNRIAAAREVLETALRLRPTSIEALNNLAVLEARVGNVPLGLSYLDRALSIDRAHTITLANRGVLLSASGRLPEALTDLRRAVAQAPRSLIARATLAEVLVRADRTAEAAREYRAGLAAHPDWWEGYRALAFLLATDADSRVRRGPEALALAERLCAATSNRDPAALEALAAARAETAQFDGAVAAQSQAIDLWRVANRPDRLATAERRLEAYRQSRPWREPRGVLAH